MELISKYRVVACPTTELSITNRAIVNPTDTFSQFEHIAIREIRSSHNEKVEAFVFSVTTDKAVEKKCIAFNLSSRKWASLQKDYDIQAAPYKFLPEQCLSTITFYTDFLTKRDAPVDIQFDTEDMAKQFTQQFNNQAFTVGQIFAFSYKLKNKNVIFDLKVKEMEGIQVENTEDYKLEIGLQTANTVVMFERAEGSDIQLVGGLTGTIAAPRIFSQNWDFSTVGVGGLGKQFEQIFRRAFASRLLPPQFSEKLGSKHVRGILLYGPPGTGKTLIARQIGKMLLAREPKIVNGPEILNKFVGESEANIRKLFQDAEEEQAKKGIYSGLHMIIFDEFDSICKQRGSSASSAGVGDNVVNQLLAKIDGINALHNVLLIGMTNRKELIDEALLRPGRFQVQIEIGLPNEEGRLEILKIHTRKLQEQNVLAKDVDLEELASVTKNYTGAELEGLVMEAQSRAFSAIVKVDGEMAQDILQNVKVTKEDFVLAMKHDIKPALGASEDQLNSLAKPMFEWDPTISRIQSELSEIVDQLAHNAIQQNEPYFVLLKGARCSGLTTVAVNMAAQTKFPFIRVYLPHITSDRPESARVQYMKALFDDASRSELSCIVLDDIDTILDYCHIGPRFSNTLCNVFEGTRNIVLSENRKMLVICTCRREQAIKDMDLSDSFHATITIPSLTQPQHVDKALSTMLESGDSTFTPELRQELVQSLGSIPFTMGIKKLEILNKRVAQKKPEDKVKEFLRLMHTSGLVIRHSRLDQPFI